MPSVAWAILAGVLGATAPQAVAPVSGGNALTLPAQRHLVRVAPPDGAPIWLLAVQQGSAGSGGLVLLRSDDEARTWRELAPVQPDATHADRADLVVVGSDVALVYSYEGPGLSGSSRHDVYFQWWRYRPATRDFAPEPAVRVFDSASSTTAYSRALLAVDSLGRLWVQAFQLEADGGSTAVLAVSVDGGESFVRQDDLGRTRRRGGGRLLHLGDRLLFLWAMHDGYEPTRMRLRLDTDPLDAWRPQTDAFSDGIYHGAALSAVAAGGGTMHLVYKDETETLYHRFFDGLRFGPRLLVESRTNWSLQPAITRVGDALVICYNQPDSAGLHPLVARTLVAGALTPVATLDPSATWKGYPAAVDVLPPDWGDVPCVYGRAADANSGGLLYLAWADHEGTGGLPPDGGTPLDAGTPPDAGTSPPDAGVDAGVDAGTPPPPPETVLFSDAFARTSSELGPQWQETTGFWKVNARALSDLDGLDVATETAAACTDCRVETSLATFGVPYAGVFLRAPVGSATDRYEGVVLGSGRVQVRKVRAGGVTVLGEASSGLSSLGTGFRLVLSARGTGPVRLTLSVNGVVRLSTEDTTDVLAGAGRAGLVTNHSGVWFDDFRLVSEGEAPGPAPDAGTPDAGTPDAGAPDAGTPDAGAPDAGAPDAGPVDAGPVDAGTPDAGIPDAGAPDAGAPDAGAPDAGPVSDAGTPDAGAPVLLHSDDFSRSGTTLGNGWVEASGDWYMNGIRLISDRSANRAAVGSVACRDCRVEAQAKGFGVSEIGVFLRAPTSTSPDRYDLALRGDGRLELRRVRGTTVTVLGTAPSGLASLSDAAVFSLAASGATLTASVNGTPRITVTDTSSAALMGAGHAGVLASSAGVWFDSFRLWSLGGGVPPPPPPPDAGIPDAGTPDAGPADAGTPDAGPKDAGTPDAGTPDAGTPDAGAPDAGTPDAGTPGGQLTFTVTLTNTQYFFLARDPAGTAYAVRIGSSGSLYASTDNARTWALRGSHASGNSFRVLTAMSDGTLLAQTSRSSTAYLSRSTDGGRTWSDVLNIGANRALTSHSWAELDGAYYFAEYQTYTGGDAPIRVWASTDRGATWSVRSTHTAHRHAHGIRADPARGALWLFFGDTSRQSAMKRSTDGGRTWTTLRTGQESIAVDGTVLPDGAMLFGQDISYLPSLPGVARIGVNGSYTLHARLPGPSYSLHALSSGGFVVNASREPGGDIYPPGEESTYLFSSPDGVTWTQALKYRRLSSSDNARIDVYWELPSGELVLEMHNVVQGDPSTGKGYQLLRPVRR